MSNLTLDELKGKLNTLIEANAHARSKGDEFKAWIREHFKCDARISYIKEQRQITNRVSEQFRYFAPIVVFVCVPDVKRDSLIKYITERLYDKLENVAIVGVTTSSNGKHNYAFEKLLVLKHTDFTKWAEPHFTELEDIDPPAGAANASSDIEKAIKKCWEEKAFEYVEVEPLYEEFQARFGKEAIKSLVGSDILSVLFGKKDDNSLVYCLEHVSKYHYFGGVGGFRTIYTLYEKDGEWKYGTNPRKVKTITEDEAVAIATEYRDAFVALFDKLDALLENGQLDDLQGFAALQQIIKDNLGEALYNRNWVWKYLHMIYPTLFMNVFTFEWVSKIFRVAEIVPGSTYTTQCGQFSLFAKKLELQNVYLYHILRELDDAEEQPAEDEIPMAGEDASEPEITSKKYPMRSERTNKNTKLNIILYGAPGTGKTYSTVNYALKIVDPEYSEEWDRKTTMQAYKKKVEEGFITFTTFHQSYGYEDFIQGLRPVTVDGNFELKPFDGVFKMVSDRAVGDFDNDYVIIIDEINRGNISKVLGELITLIEEDKRWGELNEMSVTLPSGDFFTVPNNLYIIGTMNTADKSISLIDTALRRRFSFVEVTPNLELVKDPDLRGVLKRLNDSLEHELESTDLLIGHAYFIDLTVESFADVMNQNIIPLLYEYFYDNRKAVEKQIKCAIGDLPYEIQKGSMGRLRIAKKAD